MPHFQIKTPSEQLAEFLRELISAEKGPGDKSSLDGAAEPQSSPNFRVIRVFRGSYF